MAYLLYASHLPDVSALSSKTDTFQVHHVRSSLKISTDRTATQLPDLRMD